MLFSMDRKKIALLRRSPCIPALHLLLQQTFMWVTAGEALDERAAALRQVFRDQTGRGGSESQWDKGESFFKKLLNLSMSSGEISTNFIPQRYSASFSFSVQMT